MKQVVYLRYCGDNGASALKDVYSYYDRLLNFFYQGRKLISKERLGAGLRKPMTKPRLLLNALPLHHDTQEEIKDEAVALWLLWLDFLT